MVSQLSWKNWHSGGLPKPQKFPMHPQKRPLQLNFGLAHIFMSVYL